MEQRKLVISSQIEAQNRVARVGHQILVAGAGLCKDKVGPKFGFVVLNESVFGEEFLSAARALGLSKAVEVSYVVPGSTAESAGLMVGDRLKKVREWEVPLSDSDPLKSVIEKIKPKGSYSNTLSLTVGRGETEEIFEIPLENACDYPVHIGKEDSISAYADGNKIVIEKGMLRFAENDEELGLVIAHELAHNAMGHSSAKKTNVILGGAVGLILDVALSVATYGAHSDPTFTQAGAALGAGSYSVKFEQEADYVGMYFMKRAGYDIADAPTFWRRMAIESPDSIEMRKTHPTTPERFVGLEAAIDEIDGKAVSGAALVPEMKK